MSVNRVREHFQRFGLEDRIREFDVSSATVPLAAQAVGCVEERIAKTLCFKLGEDALVLVAAGDARVDNRKFKVQFGKKARMPSPEETETLTGYPAGGVCPFALREGVRVFLDLSLKRFDTVFPSCGSPNSAVEVSIEELESLSSFEEWVDVCNVPERSGEGDVQG